LELKSRNSGIVILAPSKFHDVEIPRFQQKSWNREFESQTRKLGIVILAYTVLPVHSVGKCNPNLGIWDFHWVSNATGGRICKWEFRNFTKAGASSILPQPAFFHVATQACGCWRRRPLATARLEASSSEPRRDPNDYNSGPVGQGNDLRAMHRAHGPQR
jgi:hypothetical protein